MVVVGVVVVVVGGGVQMQAKSTEAGFSPLLSWLSPYKPRWFCASISRTYLLTRRATESTMSYSSNRQIDPGGNQTGKQTCSHTDKHADN